MGLTNRFFEAADDANARHLVDEGADTEFEASGLTAEHLDTLLAALTGATYEQVAAQPPHWLDEPGDTWLVQLRPALVDALVQLDPDTADGAAAAWVATDAMAGVTADEATDLIYGLAEVAGEAQAAGRPVYFWGSV